MERPVIVDKERFSKLGDLSEFNKFLWDFHDQIVEATLRGVPAMVSTLIQHSAVMHETVEKFYKEHPEFKDSTTLVAGVIEKLQSEFPGDSIESLLKKAVPIVEQRIKEAMELDGNIRRPDLAKANESLNGVF